MSRDDRLLTEFTVTPMIQHAIGVLCAAIPRRDLRDGAIGIRASFGDSGFGIFAIYSNGRHGTDFRPTDEQVAATCLLAATFGLHQAALRRACGIAGDNDNDESYPSEYRAALERLNANARRKVKVEGSQFFHYDNRLNGGVTVYL